MDVIKQSSAEPTILLLNGVELQRLSRLAVLFKADVITSHRTRFEQSIFMVNRQSKIVPSYIYRRLYVVSDKSVISWSRFGISLCEKTYACFPWMFFSNRDGFEYVQSFWIVRTDVSSTNSSWVEEAKTRSWLRWIILPLLLLARCLIGELEIRRFQGLFEGV